MNATHRQSYKGHLYVVISTFGFGIVPVLAKYLFDNGLNSATVLTYRFLIAGTFFLIYAFVKKLKLYEDMLTSAKLMSIGFLYALESTCFFEAFKHISPSIGQLIFQINPLMVALVALVVFKDKFTKRVAAAIALSIFGCTFLFWNPADYITLLGVGYILLAAFFYTVYVIFGKQMLKGTDPMVVTTYTIVGGGLFLLLYSLVSGSLMPVGDTGSIGAILILSLFSTIISIFTFTTGLNLLSATAAAILSALEPVFTVILAYLVFGEMLNAVQILGGVFIVCSTIVIGFKSPQQKV